MMMAKIDSRTNRFWNTHKRPASFLAMFRTAGELAFWKAVMSALMFLRRARMSLMIWAMMYSISANKSSNNEMIMMISAKIGNRFKNSGIQEVNRVLMADMRANGFMRAHRTSIIQIIRRKIGKKNLYSIKNGMNWSSSFMIPSKTSFPKLGFS